VQNSTTLKILAESLEQTGFIVVCPPLPLDRSNYFLYISIVVVAVAARSLLIIVIGSNGPL